MSEKNFEFIRTLVEEKENFEDKKTEVMLHAYSLYFDFLLDESELHEIITSVVSSQDEENMWNTLEKTSLEISIAVKEKADEYDEIVVATKIRRIFTNAKKQIDQNVDLWPSELKKILKELHAQVVKNLHLQKQIRDSLSLFFEQVYSLYTKEETEISNDSLCAEKLLQRFLENRDAFDEPLWLRGGGKIDEKRQPSFLESVEETLIRFNILEQLTTFLSPHCKGIIVGGSLSYGPFYNIRGKQADGDSSDIDLIMIVEDTHAFEDEEFLQRIKEFRYFNSSEAHTVTQRARQFPALYKNNEADILSQKLSIDEHGFQMSIHFFTLEKFDAMIGAPFSNEIEKEKIDKKDRIVSIRDFKDKEYTRSACVQKSFDGSDFVYAIPEQQRVDGGVVVELLSWAIEKGKFVPGIYQNLISPQFSVWHDRDDIVSGRVAMFKNTLVDRLTFEKTQVASDGATVFSSHVRYKLFSPSLLVKDIT